jgi:chaperonin GroEL
MTKSASVPNRVPYVAGQADARRDMQVGVNRMADVLAPTLGPTGTPVVCEGNSRTHLDLLDDAATIVRRIISLGDPRLDVGAMIVRNVVWRVDQRAGDGGATTAVLMKPVCARSPPAPTPCS